METNAISLSEIIVTQVLFVTRLDVQIQSLIIIVSLITGWLLSKAFWKWFHKKFPKITTFVLRDEKLSANESLALFIQTIDFPLITFILLQLIEVFFHNQNWTRGLIIGVIKLVLVYLIYRCLLALLYGAFPLKIIYQYDFRLFTPLFILYVLSMCINFFTDLEQLSQVVLITLFNSAITFGEVFSLIIGLYFWVIIVLLSEKVLLNIINSQTTARKGSIEVTLLLIRYFLIALGIVLNLGYAGFDGRALTVISGGLSVGIGFGLKEIFSNFISGIFLLFEKVLKPGDLISIEGQTCEVKKLGIRATTVKLLVDNSEKIIPNQTFFTQDITTYTGTNNLVNCCVFVGVGYDSSAVQVMDLLFEIAYNHPLILKNPSPLAFFLNFGDSSLNFELKFWLDDVNLRKRVISDLNCSILTKFANHNIEIPYPQRDIHLIDKVTAEK